MFYYLNGTVAALEPQLAVIDCGGVGYACNTTAYTISRLTIGKPAKLYTYLSVREDAVDIFGFSTKEELELYKKLIGVSGVGPKAALSILSSTTPERLILSIMTGDEKSLTVAQGIGKKIAQRVILELRDKLEPVTETGGTVLPEPVSEEGKTALSQAQAALVALGYSPSDAASLMKGLDVENMNVEEIIRSALRKTL